MSQTRAIQSLSRSVPAAAKTFLYLLERLQTGHLQCVTPEGECLMFGDLHQPPSATLIVNDWRACGKILRAGDIGFAESYEAGWVDSPDLTALLRLALRNEAALSKMVFGSKLDTLWYRIRHWLRPNTRQGSRRNIHAHYDIGNDFYQRWLDTSWTYSSAIFNGDYSQSLHTAQLNKYQRIIDMLGLCDGSRVLEVGCGWGGFAEYAATQGINIHGITISNAQLEIGQARIRDKKLEQYATLELRDYRDLEGQYDAIVSIEMFEAVGERFWKTYFNTLSKHLKPGGKALIQTITIAEAAFERYRSSPDFIQQYIFPGGMLPSPQRFVDKAAQAGLSTEDQYHFGGDYAETMRRWHTAWESDKAAISAQGFDERFMRIWRLYLTYCEAGFDEGKTDVVQFLLTKH